MHSGHLTDFMHVASGCTLDATCSIHRRVKYLINRGLLKLAPRKTHYILTFRGRLFVNRLMTVSPLRSRLLVSVLFDVGTGGGVDYYGSCSYFQTLTLKGFAKNVNNLLKITAKGRREMRSLVEAAKQLL